MASYPTCPTCGFRAWDDSDLAGHRAGHGVTLVPLAERRRNQAGRQAWMVELGHQISAMDAGAHADAEWNQLAMRMTQAGQLGRTEAWKAATSWAEAQIAGGAGARWAVLQATVWLAHANS